MSFPQTEDRGSHTRDAPVSMDELESCIPCKFPTLAEFETTPQKGYLSLETTIANNDIVADFCTRHSISVATLLQTTWAIVLGGYTGTTDVCFGVRNLQSPVQTTLFKIELNPSWSLLDTVHYVQSSEQCCARLSEIQWQRLLQPGPGCIANTEMRLELDQHDMLQHDLASPDCSRVRNHTVKAEVYRSHQCIIITNGGCSWLA